MKLKPLELSGIKTERETLTFPFNLYEEPNNLGSGKLVLRLSHGFCSEIQRAATSRKIRAHKFLNQRGELI